MGGTGSPFCKEDTDRCSVELVLSECRIPETGSVMSLGGWGQWGTKGASGALALRGSPLATASVVEF